MIYLDNAATTFPKPDAVVETVDECMRNWCANPGRAGHAASMKSGEAVSCAKRDRRIYRVEASGHYIYVKLYRCAESGNSRSPEERGPCRDYDDGA